MNLFNKIKSSSSKLFNKSKSSNNIFNKKVSLHDALHSSYHPNDTENLSKKGYIKDNELSNHNQSVYYNPDDKKLLYNVAGTHNKTDWGTNAMLAIGKLKSSKRYKEADNTLKKAQDKYKTDKNNTSITGHSLGGAIAQGLHNRGATTTLDAGYTIGQKTRGDAYRSKGDVVSLLGANGKHMKTLGGDIQDPLKAHNISNVKNEPIYL